MKYISFFVLFLIMAWQSALQADCCGKIEGGPAYVHVDILESGKTVHRMNMGAFKGDASYIIKKGYGFVIKPSILYATTGGKEYLASGALGFGHCTPINQWLTLTPSFGVTFTYVRTKTKILALGLTNLKETFWSTSPYIGIDACCKIADTWRVVGVFQYAISRTHTNIQGILKDKSQSQGPSYAVLLEKDITDKVSVNLGAAYNLSLSKEKHGLRGMGAKASIAYWF